MNSSRLMDILSGVDGSGAGRLARAALLVLEKPYRAIVAARNAAFDSRLRSSRPAGRVTVSVGNLTTGGTGKTPMVIAVARRLRRAGATPAVLLRGYKRTGDRSDEEILLANALDNTPVIANPDRMAAAKEALERDPAIDIFILDDGFQHRQVHRDLDLVLIDATQPFGFEHVLPRGLLREPPRALRRADAVIITRADQVDADRLFRLDRRIEQLTGRAPIAHAAHAWVGFHDAHGRTQPLDVLKRRQVAAVCAIGNPAPFLETLAQHVASLVKTKVLPDHYAFTQAEIRSIMAEAQQARAEALVMTEKDWVKWMPWVDADDLPLPIYRPALELRFLDGEEALESLLLGVLDKR